MRLLILFVALWLIATGASAQPSRLAEDSVLLSLYQSQRFGEAANMLKKDHPEPVADTKTLSALAYTSLMAGNLADAEGYYRRLYNIDSTNTSVLFNLGAINLRRGNNLQAEAFYKKIAQRDTTNFMVYKQLALLSSGNVNPAIYLSYLLKANRLNSAEPDVASDLSDEYVSLKQYNNADTVLSRAITADPENVVLLLSRLKLVYAEDNWEDTKSVALQLKELGNQSAEVLTKIGIAYYNLKDFVCAIESLADISDQEQSETSFYITALAYKALKHQTEATQYLAKAINAGISSNIADYYAEMAGCFERLQRLKKAVVAYQKAQEFNEKTIVYYMIATIYDSGLKNKKMARFYYRKYITGRPPKKEEKYLAFAQSRLKLMGK